jgi:hypothetical protein
MDEIVTKGDILNGSVPKKVVHYSRLMYCVVGESAECVPVNHSNSILGQTARNGELCFTSIVRNYDEKTGVFETVYSIYKPEPSTDYYTFN